MQLKVIESGTLSAKENMEIDATLLSQFNEKSDPILRFYSFEGQAATYGHFIKPEDIFESSEINSLSIAKRPTGGGVIFHLTDFTFSLFIPEGHPLYSENTLTSYQNINQIVIESIGSDLALLPVSAPSPKGRSFCMAHPTKYDILLGNRKVGGAAQRRVKGGFLHQASLLLTEPPYELIEKVLIDGESIVSKMKESSSPLFSSDPNALDLISKLIGNLY